MQSVIRRCTQDDVQTILDLSAYAYGFPRSSFTPIEEKLNLIYSEFFLHEVEGTPVATARLIPLMQNIRSVMKPMAAIGMVVSAPEHRRRGYVKQLMFKMLTEFNKGECATSMLYPFKDTFYSAMGYVKMPPTGTLEFNPKLLKMKQLPKGYTVKRETGDDAFEIWRRIHEESVRKIHGGAERGDLRWKDRQLNFRQKIAIARNAKGEPEAVMVYSTKGYGEGHPWAEEGSLNIGEMHWSSLEGRDALLSFVYSHSDQIIKASVIVSSRTDDYYHWIQGIHTPKIRNNIMSMGRVVNVGKSFNGIPVQSERKVVVEIMDPHLRWNNGNFIFRGVDGILQVEKEEIEAEISITIEGITAILYGTLDSEQLVRNGWVKGQISNLMDWFPRRIPWLTEEF